MKKLWIILGSIVGVLGLVAGIYFLEESYTEAILYDKDNINTTYNEEYLDPGFDLYHNGKQLAKDSYTYETNSDVDTSKLGTYKVIYDIKYHLRKFHLERIVNVIDDVKPEITVNLEKMERDFCSKKDKNELKYTAIDNYDGDITDKVERKEDEENVILSVTDESNNVATLNIPIDYGNKPSNVIKLNGDSTVYVKINNSYTEKGAGYYDGCGNKLNDEVTTSGTVDTKKEGNYTITYSVSDGTKATRKVVVYKEASGNYNSGRTTVTGNGNGKILYLTFDDGPSVYTQKILNTLAKYNVKATFFVTNQSPGYAYQIKKEYEAGHTVAVHTYTHNYNIYKSVDAYINDFNKMNSVIEKYTGSKSKIFRFPGGSSNTVSRNYAKGVVKQIANRMTNMGYVYFDWDVSSGDASGASRTKIYNNVVNGASWCKKCVILMHDIKYNTAYELDNILKTLTAKGYRFGTLSTSSPTVHHSIAN